MLERLECLPFEGLLDWTSALSLWQFHREHLDKDGTSAPGPDCPVGKNGSVGELGSARDDSSAANGAEYEKTEPSNNQVVVGGGESGVVEKSTSTGEGKRLYSSLLKKEAITFRVTCTRGGRKHAFSSPEAARAFGAGLAEYFDWRVRLKDPDIEVLLAISGDEVRVGVALNREAQFKRNIAHFGPTTLRATIAYGILR